MLRQARSSKRDREGCVVSFSNMQHNLVDVIAKQFCPDGSCFNFGNHFLATRLWINGLLYYTRKKTFSWGHSEAKRMHYAKIACKEVS